MAVKVKICDRNQKGGKLFIYKPVFFIVVLFFLEGVLTCEAGLSNSELTYLGKHLAALDPVCFPLVPMYCICTERKSGETSWEKLSKKKKADIDRQ